MNETPKSRRLEYLGLIAVLLLLLAPVPSWAQGANTDAAQRSREQDDRTALKAVVDTFSILADKKDVDRQLLLFTEDASVESFSEGKLVSSLKGRAQIGQAFSRYLANFETVFHMNGQQSIELHGDRATGTSYCLVVLIGMEGGKKIKNTSGVIYSDEYVRRGNGWLIAKRVSNFTWRERSEIASTP